MTPPLGQSESYRRFWARAEALATGAFLTIPYAGPVIAHLFTHTIVPTCEGPRDRMIGFFVRCFRLSEEKFSSGLLRLLPRRRRA